MGVTTGLTRFQHQSVRLAPAPPRWMRLGLWLCVVGFPLGCGSPSPNNSRAEDHDGVDAADGGDAESDDDTQLQGTDDATNESSDDTDEDDDVGTSDEDLAADDPASPPASAPPNTLLEVAGCQWLDEDPEPYCSESPCALANVRRLHCEQGLTGVSLVADRGTTRIGFTTQEALVVNELTRNDVTNVDLSGVQMGTYPAWLWSTTHLIAPDGSGYVLSTETAPGDWQARRLGLLDDSNVAEARLLDDERLRVLAYPLGETDSGEPARLIDEWDDGDILYLPFGTGILTPEGSVISQRYEPVLGIYYFAETTTQDVQSLLLPELAGMELRIAQDGTRVVVSNEAPNTGAPDPTSTMVSSAHNLRVDLLSDARGTELSPLVVNEPRSYPSCNLYNSDVRCPIDVETAPLAAALDSVRAVSTERGAWVIGMESSGVFSCSWMPVTCLPDGFCSHDRNCAQTASESLSYGIKIYATSRPAIPSLEIPYTGLREPTLLAAATADQIQVAASSERSGEVLVFTIDEESLPREPVSDVPELPPAETGQSLAPTAPIIDPDGAPGGLPCDAEIMYFDAEGDEVEVEVLLQVASADLTAATAAEATSMDGSIVLLAKSRSALTAGKTSVEISEGEASVVGRIDPEGQLAWLQAHPGALAVTIGPDDEIVVSGGYQNNGAALGAHLTKYAADGSVLWMNDYGNKLNAASAAAVQPDGRIVTRLGNKLVQFDADGTPLKALEFQPTLFSLDALSDGSIAITATSYDGWEWAGEAVSFDSEANSPGVLAVTDADLLPLWATGVDPRPQSLHEFGPGDLWVQGQSLVGHVEQMTIVPRLLDREVNVRALAPLAGGGVLIVGSDVDGRVRFSRYDEQDALVGSTTFDTPSVGYPHRLWWRGGNEYWVWTGGATCGNDLQVAMLARVEFPEPSP